MSNLLPSFRNTLFPSFMREFEFPRQIGYRGGLYPSFSHSFSDCSLDDWGSSFGNFKVNIKETADNYCVEAELPGVDKENIELSLGNGVLTITVSDKGAKEVEKENYLFKERSSFISSRSFDLKDSDDKEVNAKLENGVLTVVVAKTKEASKKISID